MPPDPDEVKMAEQGPRVGYTGWRLWRHLHWLRTQGLARLVEEDELNPVERATKAAAKWRWRFAHRARPPGGTAVFLVGLQRSGTNMLVRGLERSPEFAVYNENHRAAFSRFRLRPDPVIRGLIEQSRHPYVLFKPLCDAHRTADLLDGLGLQRAPRAMWAYRSVDGRARSAVAKFGDVNLRVLRELARGDGRTRWEAQRLSPESLRLIASFDWDRLGALDAAALFWYVRNRLYFELGLAGRRDVLLVSYDAMVAQPEAEMARICDFLGITYDPRLTSHVKPRPARQAEALQLNPRIRARCDDLAARLEAVHREALPTPSPGEVGR
jgi:Sulfotransferase family